MSGLGGGLADGRNDQDGDTDEETLKDLPHALVDRAEQGIGRSEEARFCHPRFRGWARASTIGAVGRLGGKVDRRDGRLLGPRPRDGAALRRRGRRRRRRRRARGAARGRPADSRADRRGRAVAGSSCEPTPRRAGDIDLLVRTAVERTGRLDVMVAERDRRRAALEGPARDRARTTGTRSWRSACAACSSAASAPSGRC